jgi:hypothetical protein
MHNKTVPGRSLRRRQGVREEETGMKRILFLARDVAMARRLVDELLLARVELRHIHVLARRGMPLEDLPEAGVTQKTDFVPASQRGLVMGGATGLLAALLGLALRVISPPIAGGVTLATSLAGAAVGSWLGGMAGMNIGNTRLRRFDPAIERGEVLVIADVPRRRATEIQDRVKQHLPEIRIEGVEPLVPPFP